MALTKLVLLSLALAASALRLPPARAQGQPLGRRAAVGLGLSSLVALPLASVAETLYDLRKRATEEEMASWAAIEWEKAKKVYVREVIREVRDRKDAERRKVGGWS